jgi:hypothetical protein
MNVKHFLFYTIQLQNSYLLKCRQDIYPSKNRVSYGCRINYLKELLQNKNAKNIRITQTLEQFFNRNYLGMIRAIVSFVLNTFPFNKKDFIPVNTL